MVHIGSSKLEVRTVENLFTDTCRKLEDCTVENPFTDTCQVSTTTYVQSSCHWQQRQQQSYEHDMDRQQTEQTVQYYIYVVLPAKSNTQSHCCSCPNAAIRCHANQPPKKKSYKPKYIPDRSTSQAEWTFTFLGNIEYRQLNHHVRSMSLDPVTESGLFQKKKKRTFDRSVQLQLLILLDEKRKKMEIGTMYYEYPRPRALRHASKWPL